jgi:hypothetical protein
VVVVVVVVMMMMMVGRLNSSLTQTKEREKCGHLTQWKNYGICVM